MTVDYCRGYLQRDHFPLAATDPMSGDCCSLFGIYKQRSVPASDL
jgi:hypothetical protein